MKKSVKIIIYLIAILAIFLGVFITRQASDPGLTIDKNELNCLVSVCTGLVLVLIVCLLTFNNKMWNLGLRQLFFMLIGAALYAFCSYLFNGKFFTVPSVSQIALRPAIVIPMFLGYFFGPLVGFFTGAVGNLFGDVLTGVSISPQWSIGNGLVGFVSGLSWLFTNKKKGGNLALFVSGVLILAATAFYFLNASTANSLYFDDSLGINGNAPISLFAGISLLIGFIIVLIVRFLLGGSDKRTDAVIWSMLGNVLGIGFSAASDIWMNGYSPSTALVGEFLPSAGPNLIFAAILIPLLAGGYALVHKQAEKKAAGEEKAVKS